MRTMIAIPCGDTVQALFMSACLGLQLSGEINYMIVSGSLIYDARNKIAERAIAEEYDRVMWLDSDMTFEPDLFKRLSAHLDEGKDFITGMYFKRKAPVTPVVYSYCGIDEEEKIPKAIPYEDYPRDSVFQVAAAGMGGCMMTVDLLRKVQEKFGCPFSPLIGFGEDFSFCQRALIVGSSLWCDSSIKLGHIAQQIITEGFYDSIRRAKT